MMYTKTKWHLRGGDKSRTHSRFGDRQRDKKDRGQKWFKENTKKITGDWDNRLKAGGWWKELEKRDE